MTEQFIKTKLLLGKSNMSKLSSSRVAVFGLGGVGGYVAEALTRSGIGTLDIIDSDKINLSNLNRQILATHKTLGRYKVDVAKERILEINPKAVVNIYKLFYMPDNADDIDLSVYDYVVDAIDTITAKIELIVRCKTLGVPIISSMGAGNKIDASKLEVADIYATSVCPLAKIMRRELKARGIKDLKVIYSKETPRVLKVDIYKEYKDGCISHSEENARRITASTAFVPPAAGLIIAGEVVKDLTGIK